MKGVKFVRWAALVSVVWLATSCSTTPPPVADTRPRFQEGTAVSVVLQFHKWDSIFMTRPDYRENGYRRQFDREDLVRALGSAGIQRNLAVVLLGQSYGYNEDDQTEAIEDWTSLLDQRGFRRVVFLRAGFGDEIDGLLIVRDSGTVGRL